MSIIFNEICIDEEILPIYINIYIYIYVYIYIYYSDCFSTEENKPPPNKCPIYDTKQYDDEFSILL